MNEHQRHKARVAEKKAGYVPPNRLDNDSNDAVTPMQKGREVTPVTPLYIDREMRGSSTIEAKKRP